MTETPQGALPLPVVPGLTDLKVFARGGYATVYRAIQVSVEREVAVKVENRTLESERDQQRFLREARAAGRMSSHPHVVDLFDVGVTEDRHPYLIMELCDGSYGERMRTSPLVPADARDLGVKIADALAHAHGAGVLHRDVKPANILHSNFNPAVLADFGLAVLVEARDTAITMEVLTPAYAPPEMFRHSPPSPAVDVYALCATLYAVMYGKPPRWRADRNPGLLTLMELFTQPIPDLPGVPPALVQVLRYGMANEPTERPSAQQLRDLLTGVSLTAPMGGSFPVSGGGAGPTTGAGGRPDAPTSAAPRRPVSGPPYRPVSVPPGSGPPHPPAWSPPRDPHPTVPTPRRQHRLRWFLGTFLSLALIAGGTTAAWYVVGRGWPGPAPTPTGAPSADPPSTDPSLGAARLPGCLAPLPGGARCPGELECYGPARLTGSRLDVPRLPCATRHTWEGYAVGDLPSGVDPDDHAAVRNDWTVRRVCAPDTFRLTTGLMSTTGWRFEVLPPADPDTGDRTFRCLAGRGTDALSGPTLGR